MGQNADSITWTKGVSATFKHRSWPSDDDFICHWEAAFCGEDFARVEHEHAVAENFGYTTKSGSEIDGAEDPHLWCW